MGVYPKPSFTPNKTNRYQRVLPKRMQDEYNRLYNDPDLMDLTPELTLLKTMLTSFLQGCNEEAMESPEVIAFAAGLANSIGKMIGQIEKIQSSQVLTFSSARLMMAKAVEVAAHYIPQEQMKQFVGDWKAALQMPGLLEGQDNENVIGEEEE